MRICLICSQIAAWGKIGGFGTNTRRLGRGLVAAGVEVHVVVPRRRGQGRVETLDGMTVHGQSVAEVFAGTALYRDIDADLYHVEEPTICGYHAQRAMPGRAHLVTVMDPRGAGEWRAHFLHATWRRRLVFPAQYLYEAGPLTRRAVQRAGGVYVEAGYLAAQAQRVWGLGEPPGVLPKPVEVPEGPFEKSPAPLCVFVGRFDPIKRPELFFRLAERMPEVEFVAVGRAHEARYGEYLRRRYFDLPNLTVTGFLDPFADGRLHRILSRAWVLVHPAVKEAFPTAFQEASAHETAVLACVDPDRYVSRFGRVASGPEPLQALERGLRGLLDSGEWQARGRAGREYVRAHHAVPLSVREHLRVYREHLGLSG